MNALSVECISALTLVDNSLPVFYGTGPEELYLSYPDPGFLVLPIPDATLLSLIRSRSPLTLVATSKKDVASLKKRNIEPKLVDVSPSAVLKSASAISPLSRSSMSVAGLGKTPVAIAATHMLALLGESKENIAAIMDFFPETQAFAIQEAFLSMNVARTMRLLCLVKSKDAVGVAALLLSGHTVAAILKESSAQEAIASGLNSFYVDKIRSMSTRYIRKVDLNRATKLLSSFLEDVKSGMDAHCLLRYRVAAILTS